MCLRQSSAGSTSQQHGNKLAWCPYWSRERTECFLHPIDPSVYLTLLSSSLNRSYSLGSSEKYRWVWSIGELMTGKDKMRLDILRTNLSKHKRTIIWRAIAKIHSVSVSWSTFLIQIRLLGELVPLLNHHAMKSHSELCAWYVLRQYVEVSGKLEAPVVLPTKTRRYPLDRRLSGPHRLSDWWWWTFEFCKSGGFLDKQSNIINWSKNILYQLLFYLVNEYAFTTTECMVLTMKGSEVLSKVRQWI
jgi:hypothetical protein